MKTSIPSKCAFVASATVAFLFTGCVDGPADPPANALQGYWVPNIEASTAMINASSADADEKEFLVAMVAGVHTGGALHIDGETLTVFHQSGQMTAELAGLSLHGSEGAFRVTGTNSKGDKMTMQGTIKGDRMTLVEEGKESGPLVLDRSTKEEFEKRKAAISK